MARPCGASAKAPRARQAHFVACHETPPCPAPEVTDDALLARRYFQEAVALNPEDARYQDFDSVDAWPEFNLSTAGYAMSGQPFDSLRFKDGLQWQWRTLDECAGTPVDRQQPAFDAHMRLETKAGPKRVCWNSWIAPHNFEGFFLNMGDMLVKAGDWQTAQKIYANARLSPDYAQWKYKAMLENRIEQAQANVDVFRTARRGNAAGDAIIMNQSRFACMGCHQQ